MKAPDVIPVPIHRMCNLDEHTTQKDFVYHYVQLLPSMWMTQYSVMQSLATKLFGTQCAQDDSSSQHR